MGTLILCSTRRDCTFSKLSRLSDATGLVVLTEEKRAGHNPPPIIGNVRLAVISVLCYTSRDGQDYSLLITKASP